MAFNIPDEVIKALKEKKLSKEATAAIGSLGLEASQAEVVDGAVTLLSMYADDAPDKEAFAKAFMQAAGLPIQEKIVEKVVTKEADPDPLASLPEDVRVAMEKKLGAYKAETDAANKENAETLATLKASERQRNLDAMTIRAGAFPFLGLEANILGGIFMSISEKDPESFKKLEVCFKALGAQMAESETLKHLLDPHGSAGNSSGGAKAKVDALVAERLKANPTEKRGDALTAVLNLNPGLYDQYLAEKGGN